MSQNHQAFEMDSTFSVERTAEMPGGWASEEKHNNNPSLTSLYHVLSHEAIFANTPAGMHREGITLGNKPLPIPGSTLSMTEESSNQEITTPVQMRRVYSANRLPVDIAELPVDSSIQQTKPMQGKTTAFPMDKEASLQSKVYELQAVLADKNKCIQRLEGTVEQHKTSEKRYRQTWEARVQELTKIKSELAQLRTQWNESGKDYDEIRHERDVLRWQKNDLVNDLNKVRTDKEGELATKLQAKEEEAGNLLFEIEAKEKDLKMVQNVRDQLIVEVKELRAKDTETIRHLKNKELKDANEKLYKFNEKLYESNEKLYESNGKLYESNQKLYKSNEKLYESNKKLYESNEDLEKANKDLEAKLAVNIKQNEAEWASHRSWLKSYRQSMTKMRDEISRQQELSKKEGAHHRAVISALREHYEGRLKAHQQDVRRYMMAERKKWWDHQRHVEQLQSVITGLQDNIAKSCDDPAVFRTKHVVQLNRRGQEIMKLLEKIKYLEEKRIPALLWSLKEQQDLEKTRRLEATIAAVEKKKMVDELQKKLQLEEENAQKLKMQGEAQMDLVEMRDSEIAHLREQMSRLTQEVETLKEGFDVVGHDSDDDSEIGEEDVILEDANIDTDVIAAPVNNNDVSILAQAPKFGMPASQFGGGIKAAIQAAITEVFLSTQEAMTPSTHEPHETRDHPSDDIISVADSE